MFPFVKNRLFIVLFTSVIIIVVIGLGLFFFIQYETESQNEENEWYYEWEEEMGQDVENNLQANTTFIVDVKGEVNHPGIYEMEEGERVFDAIEAAGGLTDEANELLLNYAEKCYDEMVIFVPSTEHSEENVAVKPNTGREEKVKINIADEEELTRLPGIGSAKAAAIIRYREENGRFRNPEEMTNVPGIGEKTLENFIDLIIVPMFFMKG